MALEGNEEVGEAGAGPPFQTEPRLSGVDRRAEPIIVVWSRL
jgi:hypothetical protein